MASAGTTGDAGNISRSLKKGSALRDPRFAWVPRAREAEARHDEELPAIAPALPR